MLEFIMQGFLFLLSAFVILTVISLLKLGAEFFLKWWDENR